MHSLILIELHFIKTTRLEKGMVESTGYMLAASVAFSGTTGARLLHNNELRGGSTTRQLAVVVLTIMYGLTGFAAVFYFSWAVLGWKHLVAFLVCHMTLASWAADIDSRAFVWTAFVVSVLLVSGIEILLLTSSWS
jgi:hypothetical protein